MPEFRIEPKVKVVAAAATGRLVVPFLSTRPVTARPLTEPPKVYVAATELLLELELLALELLLELELLATLELELLATELELLLATELELLATELELLTTELALLLTVVVPLSPPPQPALISAIKTLSGTVERTSVALERFDAFIEWQFLLLEVSGEGLWART